MVAAHILRATFLVAALLTVSIEAQAEARCDELGAACMCAESFDGPESAVSGRVSGGHDFASSSDAKECWGRGGDFANFDSSAEQSMVPVSGWGDAQYALRHTGGFMWLYGKNPTRIDSSDRSICYRYYKQVDPNYGGAGGDPNNAGGACPNTTWRNKLIQSDMGGQQMQLEETGAYGCPAVGEFTPLVISVDNGPGEGNYGFSPGIDYGSCINGPCRIELCVDGNLAAGTDITYRSIIVPLATGVEHIARSKTVSPGPPRNQFLWGGDMFHSSPHGKANNGYFMHAVFKSSNQWIGAASEIENGSGVQRPATPFFLED